MTERRTYADRAQYIKAAVIKRRKSLRKRAVEYMGGKCQICGYNRCISAMDFHHRKAEEKGFGISAFGITRSWDKILNELQKCVLLCANCHREVHAGVTQLP